MFAVMCASGVLLVAMYGRSLGGVGGSIVRGGEKGAKKVVAQKPEGAGGGDAQAESSRPIMSAALEPMATPRPTMRSEVITFKENSALGEIRIKLL
jgi:hypothetical protein